ncbi:MAG: helix-turn-helix domain-containing protein [Candidatus Freyarchaeota archaeon]|nr:helix-turn-helix domain-containing protein [Candidatus Jordarchaeia archaeon]MBS7269224.1 helix-turn-helix domain-containing protein [Candidatus Jordarchaeia archaeon]MBS7279249.1 helix-turn-helix domain-containing protein [Candidatus Jordarchaeia archaeon]
MSDDEEQISSKEAFNKLLRLGESSIQIIEYILCSAKPVTPKELVEKLGITEGTAWNALSRLQKIGFLVTKSRGEYEANIGFILAMVLFTLSDMAEKLREAKRR